MILQELCDLLVPAAQEKHAADVRLGLGYTGVLLDDGRCGLAYTFRHETNYGCTAFSAAGTLQGRTASELLALSKTPGVLPAAVALATGNALSQPPADATADGLALLNIRPTDTVGMVGYFGPLVEKINQSCRTLHIFEKMPNPAAGVLAAAAEPEVLPQCQVVILTATTLLNGTFDEVVTYCQGAREVMLLGPSTPYAPRLMAAKGITVLSGVRVADPASVLRVIGEGGGTMKFMPFVKKFGVRIK